MLRSERTTEEAKRIFLETLAATGSVVAGAAAADRSKWTVYQWAERDPAFAARWDKALTRGLGVIEKEAFRRAVEGREEPLVRGDKVVRLVGLVPRVAAARAPAHTLRSTLWIHNRVRGPIHAISPQHPAQAGGDATL